MIPSFTISLDFELRWGVRDNKNADGYADAIMGGRQAIPKMLELFEEFGVAATWATVGFLFAKDRDDLISHLPDFRPEYENPHLSPYQDVYGRIGQNEVGDPLHFGLSLIRRIHNTPLQEIGSHSFSHFYCLEQGGSAEAFGADTQAAKSIARSRGFEIKSLVLPRNQLSLRHLFAAQSAGIATFRGNPQAHFYKARGRNEENPVLRALRLTDSVVSLTSTLADPRLDEVTGLINTPASRFLRPVRSLSSLLANAQRQRIKGEMTRAAQRNMNYHLWWHPHNFGRATEINLENLRLLLKHFETLRDKYGMQSMTMDEHAKSCLGDR